MTTENGHYSKAEVFTFVDICCRKVSETYGRPDRDRWTNGDYVSLSQLLFKQTRVRISPNTLKRIFGKIKTDSRYYPQKATRDALAVYIGYLDWDHFVKEQDWESRHNKRQLAEPVLNETSRPIPEKKLTPKPQPPTRPGLRTFLLFGGGILLLACVFLYVRQRSVYSQSAQLVCRNPLGENPHSAVFQLYFPGGTSAESAQYTIRYGDGKRKVITAGDSVHTHYYESPGRYFALLQKDGVTVDTATVYLRTAAWTATASMMHDTTRVYPIKVKRLFDKEKRGVNTLELAHAGVDTNRTFFVEFINSHPTTIDGDNFELKTHVTTSPDRAGVRCSQVGITVWGESSEHAFEVMKPGCVHWISLHFSDIQKSGQQDDLSFLGADLQTGGTLDLKVVNKQVVLSINNRIVYKATYTKPMKRLYGVKIRFAGIGTVDSFSLRDVKTNALSLM